MIFDLTFKTPDVLDEIKTADMEAEEKESVLEWLKKYIDYDEYVTIEVDTKKRTLTVKEQ